MVDCLNDIAISPFHSMTLCTLYTNLGMEAIQYGVSLTESQVIITSQELLPKVGQYLNLALQSSRFPSPQDKRLVVR